MFEPVDADCRTGFSALSPSHMSETSLVCCYLLSLVVGQWAISHSPFVKCKCVKYNFNELTKDKDENSKVLTFSSPNRGRPEFQ